MPINRKFDYLLLDIIESAAKNAKAAPLNLGGLSGSGGGVGGPPGGFVGQLRQSRVAYDETEAETDFTPASGMSLVDNLNHIRFRISEIESNPASALTVEDWDGNPSVSNVDRIVFSGATVTDLGGGDVLVVVGSGGGGGSFSGDPMSVVLTDSSGDAFTPTWLKHGGSAGGEYIELGADVGGKESNAGKVGYETFGAGFLFIVGAGTTGGSRAVKIFDDLYVDSELFVGGVAVTTNAHDHNGGDGAQIDHVTLSNIGTNTHAQIDTHIANTSNPHSTTALQVSAIPTDGWLDESGTTWTYASADDPVYQIYVAGNANASQRYKVGNKVKCTNNSTTFYGIIVKVGSYDGGNNRTPVDIYGGTDYDLANSAITAIYTSPIKSPDGFPLSPDKWSGTFSDTGNRSQASPGAGTIYNLGSLSMSIPIGLWRIYYEVSMEVNFTLAAASNVGYQMSLSTANNTFSDATMTSVKTSAAPVITGGTDRISFFRERPTLLALAAKTTHYLNGLTGGTSMTSIAFRGDLQTTVVKWTCAYV